MADEFTKLRNENTKLKRKLEEDAGQIAKLIDQNGKLNDEIAKLNGQIKAINDRNFMQENPTQSGSADSTSNLVLSKRSNDNEAFNDCVMDAKKPKLMANGIPNWLVEVLAWIKRTEMATSFLPTACRTFNQLCWPKLHGKSVKPHNAGQFTFSHHFDKCGNIHANIKHCKSVYFDDFDNPHCGYQFGFPVPIPFVPPPAYIQSFERITFEFLDDELVEFIKGAFNLIENVDIVVHMEMEKWNASDKCVDLLKSLFDLFREKMMEITFEYEYYIEDFCRLFPDFFCQAEKLFLWVGDPISEKAAALLADWLANPLPNANGQAKQKCLTFSNSNGKKVEREFIDRLIEQFTNASQMQRYFVSFGISHPIADVFTLENKQTGEMLALYYKINPSYNSNENFLVRYPKNEEHWKELWENEYFLSGGQGLVNSIFLDIKKFATNKL